MPARAVCARARCIAMADEYTLGISKFNELFVCCIRGGAFELKQRNAFTFSASEGTGMRN